MLSMLTGNDRKSKKCASAGSRSARSPTEPQAKIAAEQQEDSPDPPGVPLLTQHKNNEGKGLFSDRNNGKCQATQIRIWSPHLCWNLGGFSKTPGGAKE